MHSSTPSKNYKQNIVTNRTDVINVRPIVKREGKYSESLVKPGKQNAVIKNNKVKKNELGILAVTLQYEYNLGVAKCRQSKEPIKKPNNLQVVFASI